MTKKLDNWEATRTLIKLRNQAPPLKSVEEQPHFPLSLSQERLLALEQLNTTMPLYNLPYAFQLQGKLNLMALNHSLETVLSRQPVLRTTFNIVERQPRQVIQPHQAANFTLIDLSDKPLEHAKDQIITELRQAFNLEQRPGFRYRLYRLTPDEHVLGFTFHHLISDYWSENQFFKEFTNCYEAFLAQDDPNLKQLPIRYADFAQWQRQWLSQPGVLKFLLNYWHPQLQGLAQPDLPANNSTKEERQIDFLKIVISAEQVTALKKLAQLTKVKLFTILLTSLNLVLAEHLGTSDVAVFSPITNRHRPELQHLMGDFSNLLILRTDVSGNPTVTELLERVGQVVSGAIAHQDLPLQLIKASIPLKLPQVSFSYLNIPQGVLNLSGMAIESWDLGIGTNDFEIFLLLMERKGRLEGYLKYNASLLSQTTLQTMLERFQTILTTMTSKPEQPITLSKLIQKPAKSESDLLLPMEELIAQIQQKKSTKETVLQQQLKQTSDEEERYEILRQHIKAEVERIVETLPTNEQSFFDLGMDSLMSIQLSSRLAFKLGTFLSATIAFEHSTVERLTRYLAESVLGWGSSAKISSDGSYFELCPISRDKDIPLYPFQQKLWQYQQLNPEGCVYNHSFYFRVMGNLNVIILRQSFNEIARRHEILRTTFPVINSSPVQQIAHPSKVNIQGVDLQNLLEHDQSIEIKRLNREDIQCPFDLVKGPLWRVTLIRLGEESHVLGLCLHHIIVDAKSIGILIKELSILYNSFISNKPSPLPDLPVQYADFVHWQHQSLTPKVLEDRHSHWKQWLAKEPPPLELPIDRPLPPIESFQSGSKRFQFYPYFIQDIKTLSQQAGVTFFTIILTAFTTLLYRYSNRKEIVVGVPFAGRNHHQLESLIGVFSIDTFPHHINFEGNPSFMELLVQAQQVSHAVLANCDVSLERLLKTLQPKRNLRQNPLCQVLLNMVSINSPWEELKLSGLTITPLMIEDEIWRDLILNIWGEGTNLHWEWRYKKGLFDAKTIDLMMDNFKVLLEAIVTNPKQSVNEIPLNINQLIN